MRPCPTCQLFVSTAADHCPRCAADLEPIAPVTNVEAPDEREASDRELMLVGAGNVVSSLTVSGNGDVVTTSVLARVALPPIDGPAGRPRRPTLPKLPQPFAPDPLVVAVCLGIPMREPVDTIETATEPALAPQEPVAPVESVAAVETVETAETTAAPNLAPDTFSALLGVTHEHLLPAPAPPAPPVPVSKPAPQIAPIVAVPVAPAEVHTERLTLPVRRSRFGRRDPFVRRATRRERILTRICLLLVLALALSIVVLRLPLGPRPEIDASALGTRSGAAPAVSTPATTPVAESMRLQTRADLRGTLLAAVADYPVHNSYALATPKVLQHSLPELTFVTGKHPSRRLGEVSVAGSAHSVVLAEYASPGECAFARIVDRGRPETTIGPSGAQCNAAAAPKDGWSPMTAV